MESKEDLNSSLPLPADKMPECWSQDERMNSLFAQFRAKSVNPQDWNSKQKFWQGFIMDYLKSKMKCSFSIAEFNAAFKRNGCSPLCLPNVVEELMRNGEIIPEAEFVKESPERWSTWFAHVFVKSPLTWTFSKVKDCMVEPKQDVNRVYIHLKTVRDLGDVILTTIGPAHENKLLSLKEITSKCIEATQNKNITKESVKYALIMLRHTRKAAFRRCSVNNSDECLAKISKHGVQEVTEVEEGMHKLNSQEALLIREIEHLEEEKSLLMQKARSSLSGDMKQLAKSYLRKKKEIEKCIEKRAAALDNLQKLMIRIQDAHSDTKVLEGYKTASSLLKNFTDIGLTEATVQDTMDDVSDLLSEVKEFQDTISQPVAPIDSDSDLEKELEELLSSTLSPSKEKDPLLEFPELPDLDKELSSLKIKDSPSPKASIQSSRKQFSL